MSGFDLILNDSGVAAAMESNALQVSLDEIASGGLGVVLMRHAFRYRDVSLRTTDLALMRKPFGKAVLLRMLARRRCWLEDAAGASRQVTLRLVLKLLLRRLHEHVLGIVRMRQFRRILSDLRAVYMRPRLTSVGEGPPVYIRSDLVFGIESGGSVGHIAGVVNELHRLLGAVRFYSTDSVATVSPDVESRCIRPDASYADFPEIRASLFNEQMAQRIALDLGDERPRFVYQRYAANSIVGLLLAGRYGVALITEYNGSEVWINRHWGRVLANESGAAEVEQLNLAGADLVVVVSEALRQELLSRGIAPQRILVNPNGVDPVRYHPAVDGRAVRQRLALDDSIVVGFVGTFMPWHGAEVLAAAALELLAEQPESRLCFLFIGDGPRMPAVRRIVAANGVDRRCRFAGLVPQHEGPSYMAACDILVAPHVPNADGSPFFGSPTKLFEYMAMGKPIVASDLDQIGEVLSDGDNALLVEPGDSSALARAIRRLATEPDLAQRLATNARQTALERHTWRRHTERILAKLDEIVDGRRG